MHYLLFSNANYLLKEVLSPPYAVHTRKPSAWIGEKKKN